MAKNILGTEENEDEVVATTPVEAVDSRSALRNALIQKYGLDQRQSLVDQNKKEADGYNVRAAIAGIGTALSGKGGAGAESVIKQDDTKRQTKLDQFDKGRANTLQNYQFEKEFDKDSREQDLFKLEQDVNSEESKLADSLARRMGYKGAPLTANQFKQQGAYFQKMYDIEQKGLDRKEARDERRFQAGIKSEEKLQALQTPYGLANSVDDAKQLKEAHESKKSFDSKIQEMIELRKQYGGELFNREAVARGKQLSKDLLLAYKNMAKLGVLSQSDEKIINAIIPDDPLAFSGASLLGQDPILHKLEKFQKDSNHDFNTRVQTRTKEGLSNYNSEKPSATKKIRVSNGKETLEIDPTDLTDAEKDGYKRV